MTHLNKQKTAQKGFTLIELLVVIAIIGLLSTVVLASLANARKKAEDARIVAERHQVQLALELYYSNNGGYPNPTPGFNSAFCVGGTDCLIAGVSIGTKLTLGKKEDALLAQKSEPKNIFSFIPVAYASPAFTFNNVNTAIVKDLSGNSNKGIIYIACGTSANLCAATDNSYLIVTTNSAGSIYQTVGKWTTPGAYSSSAVPFY